MIQYHYPSAVYHDRDKSFYDPEQFGELLFDWSRYLLFKMGVLAGMNGSHGYSIDEIKGWYQYLVSYGCVSLYVHFELNGLERCRGYLGMDITVWCGGCWEFLQCSHPQKRVCAEEAKNAGWRFTRKYGWLCPRCINCVELPEV